MGDSSVALHLHVLQNKDHRPKTNVQRSRQTKIQCNQVGESLLQKTYKVVCQSNIDLNI